MSHILHLIASLVAIGALAGYATCAVSFEHAVLLLFGSTMLMLSALLPASRDD